MTAPIPPRSVKNPDHLSIVFATPQDNVDQFTSRPYSLMETLPTKTTSQTNSISNNWSVPSVSANPIKPNSISDIFTKLQIQPNNLNDLASYSYHLRWVMTNDYDAYNRIGSNAAGTIQLDNTIEQVTIAESGVTAGFNIRDFSLNTICGPNFQTANMPATTWTMNITEAYGMSLVDKLLTSSIELNVVNQNRCPYFMEIWFTGYDEMGNITEDRLYYHLYRLLILSIQAKATEAGTTWSISGSIDNEFANNNQIATSPALIEISAGTFGEFLSELTQKMTDQTRTVDNNNVTAATYKFVCPPEVANWKLIGPDPIKDSQRNADWESSTIGGNKKLIKFNKGMDVGQMINSAASLCPDANEWIVGRTNSTNNSAAGPSLFDNGLIKVFQIHSHAKIIGWDAYTSEYVREYTYTVVPYTSTKAYIDQGTNSKLNNKTIQQNKVEALNQLNRVAKGYQYLYTGLNTEIIHFDIDIDNVWVIALQQFDGNNSYSQKTHGPLAAQKSTGFIEGRGYHTRGGNALRVKSAQLQSQLQADEAARAKSTDATEQSQLAEKIAADQKAIDANSAALANQQVAEHNRSIFLFGDLKNNPDKLKDTLALSARDQAKLRAAYNQANKPTDTIRTVKFAEDQELFGESDTTRQSWQVSTVAKKEPSFQNADRNSDASKNQQAADNNNLTMPLGRGLFGTILGNIQDPTTFLQIDLEIRGDPYWLGPSNIDMDKLVKDSNGAIDKSKYDVVSNQAQYLSGDEMFILNFNIGTAPSEDTGIMDFNSGSSTSFNGLYRTMLVEHHFKQGQFTQRLTAYKDVHSQLVDQSLASQIAQGS